jgi:hypothetical protein
MEPGGSIQCSQELSTGPYPEPYQSNPLHPIPFYLKSILILSITPPQNMTFHDEFGPKNEVFRFKKVTMTCDRGEFNVLIKFSTSR